MVSRSIKASTPSISIVLFKKELSKVFDIASSYAHVKNLQKPANFEWATFRIMVLAKWCHKFPKNHRTELILVPKCSPLKELSNGTNLNEF